MTIKNTSGREMGWTGGRNPGAIEQQEVQGQQQLVTSSQLPTKGLSVAYCVQYGILIDNPTKGDPLFTDVRFPEGISLRPTSHSMWSELVKDGVVIASIFYKAAYYDRDAFIRWKDEV